MEFVTHCISVLEVGTERTTKVLLVVKKLKNYFFSITKVQMKPVVQSNESKLINKNKEIID